MCVCMCVCICVLGCHPVDSHLVLYQSGIFLLFTFPFGLFYWLLFSL